MGLEYIARAAPAGGAAVGETIAATVGALVISAAMIAIVVGHRSGRLPQVGRIAAFAERSSGIPGWASLPLAFVGGSLAGGRVRRRLARRGGVRHVLGHLDPSRRGARPRPARQRRALLHPARPLRDLLRR